MFRLPTVRRLLLLTAVLLVALVAVPALQVSAAAHDNDIWWNDLGHNSRDPLFRSPGGAVPTGTAVTLRLRAADGDLTAARVRVWNDRTNVQTFYPMTKVATGVTLPNDAALYEMWEATLPASPDPTIYYYRFIVEDGTATAYYEDDNARTGGWGQTFGSSPDNSWQLTHYDPAFQTPDWVKNAVIYQIFADRFRNGDDTNNPAAGQFFYGAFDTIVRSNTADWNARICDPRGNPGSTAVCADKYSQNFYGGDLQGVIDKLDYLDDLGVTAIYLNPIFESPSNHKYDTKDFLQIDDNFGTLALFQTLVAQAHSRGINIILDGVFNHSSSDSVYFDRYSRWDAAGNPTTIGANDGSGACESISSPFAGWYPFFDYAGPPPSPCSNNRDYPKWFGIFDSLPVYLHDEPAVRDYFINNGTASVGPYWMQWADGWRLDVAPEIDHGQINDPADDYWEQFRAAVHAVNPDAYIVGEEWGNATSWTVGDEWDATMNYQFAAAVLSFWRDTTFTDNDFNSGSSAGQLSPLDATGVAERLLNLQERYAPEAFAAMMNLFNSHDTNRVLVLLDPNAPTNSVTDYNNPAYDWSPAITRYKGALILQMTLPGAPTIYYGDEVGTVNPPSKDGSNVWQDDPYNRVPYPWLDQSGTPFYIHMQNATQQAALRDYVAALTAVRNSHPALRTGSFDVLDSGQSSVFAYGRALGSDVVIVLANKAGTTQAVTLDLAGYAPAGATLTDLLGGGTQTVAANGSLSVTVPARGGLILAVQGAVDYPDAPTNLTATGAANQVNLSWNAAPGADSYDVYRSQLSGGGYSVVGNTAATTYADTGVTNGVAYYYIVVAKDDTTLLTGDPSNEATAIPAFAIGWANLQWPPTLNATASATGLTDNIYGQVWAPGLTDANSTPAPGLQAQVGYGPVGQAPTAASWQWFAMTPNPGFDFNQNNDEFQGQLPRSAIGTFCYTTRYSTTGGATWFYAVNGPDEGNSTCPGPFGVLTVVASSDTTAPDAPTNLAVSGVTSASIALGWDPHPDTDGDLFGFRVYRGPVGGPYAQIAQINDAAAVSYTDTSVTAGATYEYYVTALDTSVNESAASNKVEATAENVLVDVTFRVTVPAFTGDTYPVYLVGSFGVAGFPNWDPGASSMAMTETSPNVWEITLSILDGTQLEYKFARGSWDRVEKGPNGFDEVDNRALTVDGGTTGEQLVQATIANWREYLVTAHTPADGATGVDPSAIITASWNKWSPTPPAGTFTVTGPGGPVGGSFGWDDGTLTHTFTPAAPLAAGSYTVAISGNTHNGDNQYVPVSFSFTVAAPVPFQKLNLTSECSPSTGVRAWRVTNPNAFDVNYSVQLQTTTDAQPNRVATPGLSYFQTVAVSGPNTTKIVYTDPQGVVRQVTKASQNTLCPSAAGKIIIVKDAAPADDTVFNFSETITGAGFGLQVPSNPSVTFNNVAPGSYTVTEQATPGWQTAAVSCDDADSTTSPGSAVINLAANETVTCTFTNTIDEATYCPAGIPGCDRMVFQLLNGANRPDRNSYTKFVGYGTQREALSESCPLVFDDEWGQTPDGLLLSISSGAGSDPCHFGGRQRVGVRSPGEKGDRTDSVSGGEVLVLRVGDDPSVAGRSWDSVLGHIDAKRNPTIVATYFEDGVQVGQTTHTPTDITHVLFDAGVPFDELHLQATSNLFGLKGFRYAAIFFFAD
jgi:glycosidase